MENEKNPNEIKSNINKINIDEIQKPKTIAEFINEDEIIQFISSNLNSIISYNKENKKRQKRSKHEYLHSSLTPVISLEGFLKLIIKYTEIENNTLIVSYLYIMKLVNKENFILEKNKSPICDIIVKIDLVINQCIIYRELSVLGVIFRVCIFKYCF